MKIILNSNAIQHATEKALLIKLPNSEMCFWHPSKFCSTVGRNDYQLNVWFADSNWEIKAQRTSKKTRAILESWTGTVSEAIDEFNLQSEG